MSIVDYQSINYSNIQKNPEKREHLSQKNSKHEWRKIADLFAEFLNITFKKFTTNGGIFGKLKLSAAQHIDQTLYFFHFWIEVDFEQYFSFRLGIKVS